MRKFLACVCLALALALVPSAVDPLGTVAPSASVEAAHRGGRVRGAVRGILGRVLRPLKALRGGC